MNFRRCTVALLMVLALAFAASACGGSSDGTSSQVTGGSSEEGGSEDPVHIALLLGLLNTYTQADAVGVEREASTMNATVEVFNAEFQPTKQINQCQDAITSQRFNAMIILPVTGPSMTPCAKEAIEAGIMVGAVDTVIGGEQGTVEPQVEGVVSQSANTPESAGIAAAESIIEACGNANPCKVGEIMATPEFEFSTVRLETIKEELQGHGNIEIVSELPGYYDINKGMEAARTMLTAEPDIKVIDTEGDQMALGAVRVLKEMGLEGKTPVIGYGASVEGIEEIEKGNFFASGVQTPCQNGRKVGQAVIEAARGDSVKHPFVVSSEFFWGNLGGRITKQNVKEFTPDWALLGKPVPEGACPNINLAVGQQ